MKIERQAQMFLKNNKSHIRMHLLFCISVYVWREKVAVSVHFNRPGLRGSHILIMGSEPPAAINEELSPPISRQLRTFPQNCARRRML